MQTYEELIEKIKELKELGFIQTHRSGPTGIGKTLEDLLGIKENNFKGPNGYQTELKSARNNSSSMLTLFSKNPLPRGINKKLRMEYGYPDDNFPNKKVIRKMIDATGFNVIQKSPEKIAFKITSLDDRIEIQASRPPKSIPDMETPYWLKTDLAKRVKEKYGESLLYVKANVKIIDGKEHFHYIEAWHLKGFNPDKLFKLLANGILAVDIRLGLHKDGRDHDHGTAIRIRPSLIDKCFSVREKVI